MKKNFISKFFSFFASVVDTADKHSFANISANFRKKFEMFLMGYSGPPGTLIYEKNLQAKISCQTPFNIMYRRPILCTLYGAVDFLNVLKKGCWWGGEGVCYWRSAD